LYLAYLNELAENCGLPPIFDDVHPVGENNGEVYLSKYFDKQMVRNQTVGQDKITHMCRCPTCTTYMSKNTQHNKLDYSHQRRTMPTTMTIAMIM
jgi:hypothetical protein